MSVSRSSGVDAVDLALIRELSRNARISLAEVGRRVSLSRPAVAERIRRLEEHGVIKGYGVHLDLDRLGLSLRAHVSLRPRHGSSRNPQVLRDRLLAIGHVLSCVHVTGANCYELTIAVRDAHHLEQVIEHLAELGDTTTGVVLSESVHLSDVDVAAWLLQGDH
ncbi:Lrp/AsnC family transcriptional regulator [Streptomyces poonensis]|uniref:AsnC family transcriptional regulator n=1 Tax=Streptomyces poonensis TaxID=68255 RepID=A0A918Q2D3_9ACTN|nr:Lrp/AsnC family transcriptional regulator [Streptomyces poonensis]GGZ30017.1 AsnC family transcriptional regulator [Streptomyces poonensis]